MSGAGSPGNSSRPGAGWEAAAGVFKARFCDRCVPACVRWAARWRQAWTSVGMDLSKFKVAVRYRAEPCGILELQ